MGARPQQYDCDKFLAELRAPLQLGERIKSVRSAIIDAETNGGLGSEIFHIACVLTKGDGVVVIPLSELQSADPTDNRMFLIVASLKLFKAVRSAKVLRNSQGRIDAIRIAMHGGLQ
jgi:hypothetical protein